MENKIAKFNQSQKDNLEPVFSFVLKPHRSLGKTGFRLLMGFIIASCLVSGIFFMIAGAWPVMVTLGLDALAIWIAFKINYRSGRQIEEISIWPHEVVVRKVSPNGKIKEYKFNPFWVKFLIDRHEEYGINSMKLCEKGKELVLGSFLNPNDKTSFASAFNAALSSVRR